MNPELYELTNSQKSIWNTELFFKDTPINNICGSVVIKEVINLDLLSNAINQFIKNNDSFNIHVKIMDGSVYQYFSQTQKIDFECLNFKDTDELHSYGEKFVTIPFKIIDSQLFDFKLFKLSNGFGGFIIKAHHIISDAATFSFVGTEITSNYYALKNNENIVEKNYSYIDFINSEKKYLSSSRFEKDKLYWNELYSNLPNIVDIPSSKKEKESNLANRIEYQFDKKLLAKVNAFCDENNFSLYDFLIAVYSYYIGTINQTNNFSLGTPVLNRLNYVEKHTSGMFINTSLLNITIPENINFYDFLKSIAKNSLSMLKHQKYDYQSILKDVRKKYPDIPALYDIVISYQVTKATDINLDLPYDSVWYKTPFISNSLNIHFHDNNNTGLLNVDYDYKVCKYDKNDINIFHNRIMNIINQILKNPYQDLCNLEILTLEEKNKILCDFNDTISNQNSNQNKTIIKMFEEQVKINPNNTAIIFENKHYSFKTLNEQANRLANYLISIGVKPCDTVCICLNRSFHLIASIYGVIKTGASYVLISPDFPKNRIDYIISDTNSKYCIVNNLSLKLVDVEKTINIDCINFSNYSEDKVLIQNSSNKLCIIYTSGSTGNPKGVILHEQGFINLIYAFDKEMKISKYQNILGIATVAFDMFAVELFSSILFGNTLVLANEEEQKNPIKMSNLIIKNNIEFFITTPSRVELLLLKQCNNPLKNVKAFQLGGEKFTTTLYSKLKNYTNAKIFNGYGPTEITACCTNKLITSDKNITIGKPIENMQIYICDSNMHLMPIDVPGEICVAGCGVSYGYLNNELATSKSFVKNPFGNGLIYKTGDLGKLNNNYEIEFLGRSDNQIKIRGLRIELEEIENKINELPFINSCVVVKKTNSESFDYICAYYTSGSIVENSSIRTYLKDFFPQYMLPNYFVKLDSLPFTQTGKIDKKNLPDPDFKTISSSKLSPRNSIDKKILDLLKDLLNIDNIAIDNNFFELGGDSLIAINLGIKIQSELNVILDVKDILESSTLMDLSDKIEQKIHTSTSNISIIKPVAKSDFYPASFAQKRIYFASQIAGNDSTLYNTPGGIIFDGKINVKKLEKCLNILVDRHESLRTYFELKDDNLVQKILDNYTLNLDVQNNADFDSLNDFFKDFVKPFNISKAPLFRVKFIYFSNGKSVLFIDVHHIIADGTSMSIFINELCNLYNDKELSVINTTYKDFSKFEFDRIKNNDLKEAKQYWIKQFEGECPILNMPFSYSRPAIQSFAGNKFHSLIDVNTTQKIKDFCNNNEITPYMLLLAIYYILLSKYTAQNDIVVGSPIAGRDIPDTNNIIGMFVNTLALRANIDNTISFKEFVLNLKEKLLDAFKYQAYPFDELVNDLQLKRDTSRNPLFDTMFIYQNNGLNKIDFDGVKSTYYIPDINISKFDLSLEIIPNSDEFTLNFEYATKLFDKQFIKKMSDHYLNILKFVLEDYDIKISKINMLSDLEKNQILEHFNNSNSSKQSKNFVDLFEDQVTKFPNNIAVISGDKKITYKDLNKKANSLANYLKSKGIKNDDVICICLNRSIDLIIAIFATIKSGASYVLIDTELPIERINFILHDSNAKLCIINNGSHSFIHTNCFVNIDNFDYSKYSNNLLNNKYDDNLCIIYTSGSTGTPKGVLLHKHGFANLVQAFDKEIEISKYKSFLGLASVSFDMFAFTLFNATLHGNTFVLTNEEEQKNPALISKIIEHNNVEFLVSTPSLVELLLLEGTQSSLAKIKGFVIGGEKFPATLYNKLRTVTDGKIYNGYGPTEITACCSLKQVSSAEDITIGKPISNVQIYICDSNLNLLPIGLIGEICVAGAGVANGYLNNKTSTSNSFVKNPFGSGLLYKTGDLGKFKSNGEIEYFGRIDNQVKIRGLRIELGEIESLMQKHPFIKKAVVIKQTVNNRDFLSAYFTSTKKVIINELKSFLMKSLPRYMVPNYYIALSQIPYTNNGKIDTKSLPLPTEILNISNGDYVSPKTDLQKRMVQIWEKLLNTHPIGINDNFFELGGDSLLAMNLNLELTNISSHLTYQDIFRYPTIAELEQKINSNNDTPFFNKIENLSDNFVDVLKGSTKPKKSFCYHPKSILITGATGFLGIHILEKFIKYEKCNIYCIVRESPGITARTRLHQKLNYYFGDKYNNLIDKRIFAVQGNILEPGFGLGQEDLLNLANSIDLVINSAAKVSHYGKYNDFYGTNVTSVKHLIDFCKSFNKKLYQISTISVADSKLDLAYPSYNKNKKIIFDESNLYVGQVLDNMYSRTKFEAETCILNAISQGLDGYILRMGNLMPRSKDGIFQENILDNDFINKVLSFIKLGIFPDYLLEYPINFTPVDLAAKAVYKLITHTNNTNRIFHVYNNNNVSITRFLRVLKKQKYSVHVLHEKEFTERIKVIFDNDNTRILLKNLINNFDNNLHLDLKNDIIVKSNFTIKYLNKTFFIWPKISNKYLINFINLLRKEL